MDVSGKVVLVTGGGGGIGAGIAEAFAEKGARIAITDINGEWAQAEAARIGHGTIALAHDVSSPESWAGVKEAVEAQLGPVDVLCNNAGISLPFKPMEEITLDQFDRCMAINVRGVFLGCHLFMPEMKARKSGHIVNTSSVNGQLPHGTFAVYSASKFAVAALSEAIRQELEPFGVGVSILYPGLTRSRMSMGQWESLPEEIKCELEGKMMDAIWLGRAVVRATEENRLHIVTHPDHLENLKARIDTLYSAFGEPAQPGFTGGRVRS
ncbi:SDR family oxidoreductase [Novosphingobium sp. TH158]|uniref:SDR family oxidoreductase n=1 Tax=Novosphingobium sp. TH158 TaxID=2067455 RepID=UPI000C799210|nr:SDR family oxidoreductase [Novosphingobium sp. TH158]PLK25897.1 NAD(P)-dependent oxidoreductase [Novosphingobium sp. TH158]